MATSVFFSLFVKDKRGESVCYEGNVCMIWSRDSRETLRGSGVHRIVEHVYYWIRVIIVSASFIMFHYDTYADHYVLQLVTDGDPREDALYRLTD
jgi:hypothetical protein